MIFSTFFFFVRSRLFLRSKMDNPPSKLTGITVPFDRHTCHCSPCEIWRWVIHSGFGKQGSSLQKFTTGRLTFLETFRFPVQRPPAYPISHPALFKLWCVLQMVMTCRTRACQSFREGWNIWKRVKSWRWCQVCFYSVNETMVTLYVGLPWRLV
jgi:hypothetical protein